MRHNSILVVDFGSQVTKLIVRKIREIGILSYVCNPDKTIEYIKKFNPKAIILSGGAESVTSDNYISIDENVFKLNIPILGICYGKQLICKIFGGKVSSSDKQEFGRAELEILDNSSIFKGIGENSEVWMSHSDYVNKLPNGFDIIAKTENAPFAAIENKSKNIYCVQFHPEVHHSIDGKKILENFCNIAQINKTWTMGNYMENEIEKIKSIVGNKNVISALSGGVDSAVASVLVHRAIGDNLTCIFVDTGLLRKGEKEQVEETFKKNFKINLITINAKDRFLSSLKEVSDPEEKRKIIGKLFIEIFEEEAKKIINKTGENIEFLVQGTIYPDVIESSHPTGGKSQTIKSHHNVGGLPERMKMKLIEPLRELFKDEVRNLGLELGINRDILFRHPFPGPGLAIRILGDITEDKIQILQNADYIYINELKKHKLYDKIWQAFAVLLPCRTVGVMGDGRTYDYVLAIRAVTSVDGMTADFYQFDMKFLSSLSTKITNEVRGVSRITYDITSKPPSTIEWE